MYTAAVKSNSKYTLKIIHDEDAQSPREWDNLGKMMCWHKRYSIGDKHNFDDQQQFFSSLIMESVPIKDVIAYVKEGNASGLTLQYDKSTREWDLKTYDNYFKKWFTAHTAEAPLDMQDWDLGDAILDAMGTGDLVTLAERKALISPLYLYDHSIQSISMKSFVGRAHHADWDSGQIGWVYVTHEDIKKEYGDVSPESIARAEKLLKSEVETYDHYMRGECYGFQLYDKKGDEIDSCWGFIGDFDEAKKDISDYLPKDAMKLAENIEYGDNDRQHEKKPSILAQVEKNKEIVKSQSGKSDKANKLDFSLT